MSKEIEGVAKDVLKSPALVEIGARSTPAEAVTQYVVEVSPRRQGAGADPPAQGRRARIGAGLLAHQARRRSDRPQSSSAAGLSTATLHSNRTQGQRLAALKRFRSGDVRVLIATDIAARGIDVDGISHVINFDFPPQPEDYVHRIGRTGRAQAIGDAISFVTHEDADSLRRLERFLGRGIARKKLDGYVAEAAASRRPRRPTGPRRRRETGIGRRARVEAEGTAIGIVRTEAFWSAPRPPAGPSRTHLAKAA